MKITVLTDPESAAGFRLAGLEAVTAEDAQAAAKTLARLIKEPDRALIIVSAALLPDPYQVVQRELRGRDLPLLLAMPSPAYTARGRDVEAELRRLIVTAIGYEIKL